MLNLLAIGIGIVFVIFLFSLLASTLLEFIAGFLSLRGKQLIGAIRNMVGQEVSGDFVRHPFFQQLTIGSRERAQLGRITEKMPSYINSGTFSSILLDILRMDDPELVLTNIEALPEGNLKQVLLFLFKQCSGDVNLFKKKVEDWFNEVMDRASGAYKRNSQRWLFAIGFSVALIFNADLINVYHSLSVNAALTEMVAQAAEDYVGNNPNAPLPPNLDSTDLQAAREQIHTLVNDNIGALASPLGLGWDSVDRSKINFKWSLYKLVGWLTMALAVSFGATFWFEMLKKLINVRSTGPAPIPAPMTTTTVTQTTPAAAQTVMTSGSSVLTTRPSDSVLERMAQSRDVAAPPKAHRRRPKKSRSDIPPPKADG